MTVSTDTPAATAAWPALEDVTVIVVTYNSAHCVAGMAQGLCTFPHVIVADNHSGDGTIEQVRALLPQAQVLAFDRNLGFGAANNRALAQVSTPYALLLNPDCTLQPADVAGLLATAHAWPQAALVAPQLLDRTGKPHVNYGWARRAWRSRGPQASGVCCVVNVCGAAMLLRLSALPTREWFDTRFFLYYEDEDLCLRLWQARLPALIDPAVQVQHANRGSVRGKHPLRTEWLRGKHHAASKLLFTAKHEGEAAARRKRRVTLAAACLALPLRVLAFSPRHLARLLGRIAGVWSGPVRY